MGTAVRQAATTQQLQGEGHSAATGHNSRGTERTVLKGFRLSGRREERGGKREEGRGRRLALLVLAGDVPHQHSGGKDGETGWVALSFFRRSLARRQAMSWGRFEPELARRMSGLARWQGVPGPQGVEAPPPRRPRAGKCRWRRRRGKQRQRSNSKAGAAAQGGARRINL
jgi:hypothetical protein